MFEQHFPFWQQDNNVTCTLSSDLRIVRPRLPSLDCQLTRKPLFDVRIPDLHNWTQRSGQIWRSGHRRDAAWCADSLETEMDFRNLSPWIICNDVCLFSSQRRKQTCHHLRFHRDKQINFNVHISSVIWHFCPSCHLVWRQCLCRPVAQ